MWSEWSTTKKTLVVLGSIAGLLCFILISNGLNLFSTVAKKSIKEAPYNYERFNADWTSYQQYEQQYIQAVKEMRKLEKKGKDDTQIYNNWSMQMQGATNMLANIAREYNKMSITWYQDTWKANKLPKELSGVPPEVPEEFEYNSSTVPVEY